MIEDIVSAIHEKGWFSAPGVVPVAELQDIRSYFEAHRSQFTPAGVGSGTRRQREKAIRGDFIHWLDPLALPLEFQGIGKLLSELHQTLNRRCFFGIKDLEHHLAFYPPGTHYQKHLDRFHGDSTRILSFVFYLNESWETGDGGELNLYGKDGELLRSIIPGPGTMACFLSGDFPHEVRPASKERRSLTGWMRSKIIN